MFDEIQAEIVFGMSHLFWNIYPSNGIWVRYETAYIYPWIFAI